MRFSKWQALGNTYLLVERADLESPLGADDARRLCDPHEGVGADGVLEIADAAGGRGRRGGLEPGRVLRRALRQRSPHRCHVAGASERCCVSTPASRRTDGARTRARERRRGRSRKGRGRQARGARDRRRSGRGDSGDRWQSARGHPARADAGRAASARSPRRESRALSRPDECATRSPRRSGRPDGRGLGARSGGDAVVRLERRRRRGRRDHSRLVSRHRSAFISRGARSTWTSARDERS